MKTNCCKKKPNIITTTSPFIICFFGQTWINNREFWKIAIFSKRNFIIINYSIIISTYTLYFGIIYEYCIRVITNGFDLIHQAMNELEYHNMKYLNNNHIFVFMLAA